MDSKPKGTGSRALKFTLFRPTALAPPGSITPGTALPESHSSSRSALPIVAAPPPAADRGPGPLSPSAVPAFTARAIAGVPQRNPRGLGRRGSGKGCDGVEVPMALLRRLREVDAVEDPDAWARGSAW
eukprot:RCo027639